jgi:hypothetical protein
MAQASGMLGLAVRYAQRVGIHRDGQRHNLSPWRVEMRRRMWHHIVLLDTWCMENEGSEPTIFPGSYDTALPQASNDSNWDHGDEFATAGPQPVSGFSDMTGSLVRYELAVFSRAVLEHNLEQGEARSYIEYHQQLITHGRARLDLVYLKNLDLAQPSQKIVKDLTDLTFERLYFAIYTPFFKHDKAGEMTTPLLKSE